MKLSLLARRILENEYKGSHTAPSKSYGAPLHNLKGVYPDDVYSSNASRYYGDDSTEYSDDLSISIMHSVRNKPHAKVKIYRAVPSIITMQDKIDDIKKQKAYIMKYGRVPSGINTNLNSNQYYEKISNELESLEKAPNQETSRIGINPGDWVTINKQYAISHGKSNLLKKYKILTKTVPAKHLYTVGDSVHEFGYDPS